jgi:DNA-binding SARP family transcriptional activator
MSMFLRLQLLGRVDVEVTSASDIGTALHQPRKIALLAYLACEDRPVARDELATLFWGESPEARARASLNQLIHSVRRDLGSAVLETAGRNLALAAGRVGCDLLEFYEALPSTDVRLLFHRYGTRFMPGFTLDGSHGFSEWQAAQQTRLEVSLADAAWSSAQRSAKPAQALAYVELAARVRPWDEVILRRRLQLLLDAGNNAEAIKLYNTFAAKLRTEHDTAPAAATRGLLSQLATAEHSHPLVGAADDSPSSPPTYRWPYAPLVAAAVLAAIFVGTLVLSPVAKGDRILRSTVLISDLLVDGAERQQRYLLGAVTAALARDTLIEVLLRPSSSPAYSLSGTLRIDAAGSVDGQLVLTDSGGQVVTTLYAEYAAKPLDAVAGDLARRVRSALITSGSQDPEVRLLSRVERELQTAASHDERGAFALAERLLEDLAATLPSMPISTSDRDRIRTEIAERWGWVKLRKGDIAGAHAQFRQSLSLAHSHAPVDISTRLQLAERHFLAWTTSSEEGDTDLLSSKQYILGIPVDARTPEAWLRLSAAMYGLGLYADAYSAAEMARRTGLDPNRRDQLQTLAFQAAFNAQLDRAAEAECLTIRDRSPRTWPAVACALWMNGWSGSREFGGEFHSELNAIEDPEPVRSIVRHRLTYLAAAAAARRGDIHTADTLLARARADTTDMDQTFMRAAALIGMHRSSEAEPLMKSLESTPSGRRILRSYARLLQ